MDQPIGNTLASCTHFTTTHHFLKKVDPISNPDPDRFSLITIISGDLDAQYTNGQTILLPVSAKPLIATEPSSLLQITIKKQ